RNGELFGHPRITFESAGAAFEHLSHGNAVGQPFVIRRARERNRRPPVDHAAHRQSKTQASRERPMTDAGNTLTLETTKGKVVILMRPDLAPGHVARIKELVRERFYDGVAFHRVIEGFMAQTGCP